MKLDDVYETFFEIESDVQWSLFHDFKEVYLQGVTDAHIEWEVIPKRKAVTIWEDYAKHRVLREIYHKDILRFQDIAIKNTIKIHIANILGGHETFGAKEIWDMTDYPEIKDHDDFFEKFSEWTDSENGEWRISDYGLPKLQKLIVELMQEDTIEGKLIILDRLLQVTHQRGDLSALFIEGGQSTLDYLFEA